jgi:hypothetical protein
MVVKRSISEVQVLMLNHNRSRGTHIRRSVSDKNIRFINK